MIADENVKVKEETIYSLANLIMHYLLQLILTRQRWSNATTMRSDENERDKNFYSTVKYNLIWLKEKLLILSLSKMKNEMSLDASIETMSHCLRSTTHQQLKMTWNWVHDAIMLLFKAVLTFASMLNESTTHVNHRCAQMMNATTASNHLIIVIYYVSAIIETRRYKYVYQESWVQSSMQKTQEKQKKQT